MYMSIDPKVGVCSGSIFLEYQFSEQGCILPSGRIYKKKTDECDLQKTLADGSGPEGGQSVCCERDW